MKIGDALLHSLGEDENQTLQECLQTLQEFTFQGRSDTAQTISNTINDILLVRNHLGYDIEVTPLLTTEPVYAFLEHVRNTQRLVACTPTAYARMLFREAHFIAPTTMRYGIYHFYTRFPQLLHDIHGNLLNFHERAFTQIPQPNLDTLGIAQRLTIIFPVNHVTIANCIMAITNVLVNGTRRHQLNDIQRWIMNWLIDLFYFY